MTEVDKLVYHNGLNFDVPAIQKLNPWWTYKDFDDTFIMSSLFNPDRKKPKGCKGAHSIDAYGARFKLPKPKHEDWSRFTPEMLHRCIEDVKIGYRTYKLLQKERAAFDWEQSLRLEYAVARYHAKQEMNGVPFNEVEANKLLATINDQMLRLEADIKKGIPDKCKQYLGTVKSPFKKDGTYTKNTVDWFGGDPEGVGVAGPYTRIKWHEINLNSDPQVKAYLLTQGWIPTEWNYKKNSKTGRFVYDDRGNKIPTGPKLTEESYESIRGDIGKKIALRNVLKHRRGMLQSFKHPTTKGLINLVRSDGRIPAEAFPQAAITGRYRHMKVVNIPSATADKKTGELVWYPDKQDKLFGTELRSLFYCPDPDYVMVGIDADGLEGRINAHYCHPFEGGEQHAYDMIDGDIHAKNAKIFGTTRKDSKPAFYCLMYGGQPGKLAQTLGCNIKKGKQLFNAYWDGNPALKGFRDYVERTYEERGGKRGGYLVGLDGRKLSVRSSHAMVNLMFQSAGNIVVKTATCYLWNVWLPKTDIRAYLVLHMHDEFQALVHKDDVDRYVELAERAFPAAGKYYNLNVPITGTCKLGRTWADTH
jgi:hypothetical protein